MLSRDVEQNIEMANAYKPPAGQGASLKGLLCAPGVFDLAFGLLVPALEVLAGAKKGLVIADGLGLGHRHPILGFGMMSSTGLFINSSCPADGFTGSQANC